jgi:hypothetical protein
VAAKPRVTSRLEVMRRILVRFMIGEFREARITVRDVGLTLWITGSLVALRVIGSGRGGRYRRRQSTARAIVRSWTEYGVHPFTSR